ncbi:hypothetical protein [Candidatus Tisiphia endosymbiont of Metellina segmentata]|uniref:hypothetical protein n=1 Tax=Candidatus Tisiphia endosymbiont of Metellina segmentata TaxID=3066274 RepID=UPI00313A93A1
MKTKRVNLPDNAREKKTIDNYLTGIYNKNGRFTDLQESYDVSRKTENTEAYNTNANVRDCITMSNLDEAWEFFLYLSIGVKESAFYLASSFWEGFGTTKDEFLGYLSMAIGVKLGDKKSIELVGDEPIPKDAKDLADKCITQINKNAREVGSKKITYEEAIGYGKLFDKILKSHSKPTFEENILPGSIKGYADFVEVVEYSFLYPTLDTFEGASSSQLNASYETCPDTSDSEADIVLAGSTKLHVCCEIM